MLSLENFLFSKNLLKNWVVNKNSQISQFDLLHGIQSN